jgi:hypothetical protein
MRKTILGLAAVACVVPALAFAADPAPNSSFRYCESNDSNNCPFTFKTNRNGTKLKKITAYNKCAPVPVPDGYPKIPVNNEGKFSKSGTVTDVIGEKLQFKFQGKFKKPGKAVGTYDIDRQGCNAQPKEFVAKRVQQ